MLTPYRCVLKLGEDEIAAITIEARDAEEAMILANHVIGGVPGAPASIDLSHCDYHGMELHMRAYEVT